MLRNSWIALAGVLLALTLALTGCGGGQGQNDEQVSQLTDQVAQLSQAVQENAGRLERIEEQMAQTMEPAQPVLVKPERVKVRLALDWFPNANHAGLFTAVEKGYFEDENLEVEIYTPVDPASILQTVAAGADDFGINYQPDLLLARAQGVPVVSVASLVQHPLNSVQTLKASGISQPSHLVGKTVGYPGIPINEPLLETMLKFDGVAGGLDEVELVNVGFSLSEALISGQVDACIGCYFSYESIKMENEGFPVEVIRMEQWGVPDFYELVVVTNEDTLAERPDVVQRFVRAVIKGYEEAAKDPEKAVDSLVALSGGEIDEAIDRPGAKILAPLWKSGDTPVGWQTSEKWSGFAQWMYDNGIVDEPLDASKAFTNEFVE